MYDAVIILANGINEHGQLDQDTKARMDEGLKLLLSNKTKNLVPCGGQLVKDKAHGTYSEVMARYALENMAVKEDIYLETYSQETVGQAILSKRNIVNTLRYGAILERKVLDGIEKKIIPAQYWNKLVVITSDWHVERVREIFNFVYSSSRFEMDYVGVPVNLKHQELNQIAEREALSLASFKKNFHFIPAEDELEVPIDEEDFRPWFANKEEYRDSLLLKHLLTTDVRYW